MKHTWLFQNALCVTVLSFIKSYVIIFFIFFAYEVF